MEGLTAISQQAQRVADAALGQSAYMHLCHTNCTTKRHKPVMQTPLDLKPSVVEFSERVKKDK